MTEDAGAASPEGTSEQSAQGSEQDQETGQQNQAPKGQEKPQENTLEFWQAEAEKWKQSSRRHERTSRENSSAAAKLAQMEDANKTELQRAQERADKAERERAEERAERHRLLAAAAHGLGPDFVDYLGSGEEEDIFARAEQIAGFVNTEVNKRVNDELARMGIQRSQGNGGGAPTAAAAASLALGRRPAESLRPGGVPASNQANANDPNEAFRQMLQGGR